MIESYQGGKINPPKWILPEYFLLQIKVLSFLDALLTTSTRCLVEQDSFYPGVFYSGISANININALSNQILTCCELLSNNDVFTVILLPAIEVIFTFVLTCAKIITLKETTNQKYSSGLYTYSVISFILL